MLEWKLSIERWGNMKSNEENIKIDNEEKMTGTKKKKRMLLIQPTIYDQYNRLVKKYVVFYWSNNATTCCRMWRRLGC